VGVINDFDRTETLHALHEEKQVFPPEIVGFACGAWEALRVQSMIAILLIHAGAHFVDFNRLPRSDKEATTLFGIGLSGMGIDFLQYLVRNQQRCSIGVVCL
jgi:hypothetical protein